MVHKQRSCLIPSTQVSITATPKHPPTYNRSFCTNVNNDANYKYHHNSCNNQTNNQMFVRLFFSFLASAAFAFFDGQLLCYFSVLRLCGSNQRQVEKIFSNTSSEFN